jgi:hypothetical protein
VVVRDFDFIGVSILPAEAGTELIVDPNAVLAASIASQSLKAISRRC